MLNELQPPVRDLREDILREQVRLAAKQMPMMQAASFIVALITGFAMRHDVPLTNIVIWEMLVGGVVMGRIVFHYRFSRQAKEAFDGEYWKRFFLALGLASGIVWSLSTLLIFPAGNIEMVALLVLIMCVLAVTTIVSHASLKLGPAVWMAPVVGAYIIRMFLMGGEFGYTLGALLSLYLGAILSYSFRSHAFITSYITLKFENLELLNELQASTKIKDQFVTLVSHDLKAPITSINGWLSLMHGLTGTELAEVRDKGTFKHLADSSQSLLLMIEQLLSHSRLKYGKVILEKRYVGVHALAGNHISILSHLVASKGITLRNELPEDMRVVADPGLFGQVMHNLLSNAIKFTPAKGEIRVFAPRPGENIVAVQNGGSGIRNDLMEHLFRSDVKTTTTGTAGEKGTGLGLPYAHDVMKTHGGSLTVESGEGKGAVFYASFPKVNSIVMVVDDLDAQRDMIVQSLKKLPGVETLEASNGRMALKTIGEIQPDLIITDNQMPVMSGAEMLKTLRENPACRSIPVIMASAFLGVDENREQLVKDMLSIGANECLAKPVMEGDLLAAVRRQLNCKT